MGRCIAMSEARRRPRPLRTLPRATPARRSQIHALPNPAAGVPHSDTSASKARHWMLGFWTWLLTPRGSALGR